MRRFFFVAAAFAVLASSPAAAERPWRPGGHTGGRRCAAVLQWASLEWSRTAAERASLRSATRVACSPARAAPPPPAPKASPPPTRYIRVLWSAWRAAGARGDGRTAVRKIGAGSPGATSASAGAGLR